MIATRFVGLVGFLGALFTVVGGCSGGGDDRLAPGATTGDATGSTTMAAGTILGECTVAAAGAGFVSAAFPAQSSRFVLDMMVYPYDPNGSEGRPIDAIVGISHGAPGAFTDLAASVRFNPQGNIDVRRGSEYAADRGAGYRPNMGGHRIVMDIDPAAHVYSVWQKGPNGEGKPTVKIAGAYPFRTEQASVTVLDRISAIVDSTAGALHACSIQVGACSPASAGTGWSAREIGAQRDLFRVELDAEALDAPIDGVIGLANGIPAGFGDLAANIRFNAEGKLDVRNGDVYAADAAFAYVAGRRYHVIFDVNQPAARYSVSVRDTLTGSNARIATDYAFRTEQAGVTELNHIGSFVDLEQGEQLVCNPTVTIL